MTAGKAQACHRPAAFWEHSQPNSQDVGKRWAAKTVTQPAGVAQPRVALGQPTVKASATTGQTRDPHDQQTSAPLQDSGLNQSGPSVASFHPSPDTHTPN